MGDGVVRRPFARDAIEHWDGSAWSPQQQLANTGLEGIHTIAANDIYAVGFGTGPAILHYDVVGCRSNPCADPAGGLFAVNALPGQNLWAAGRTFGSGRDQTLAERAPSPVSGAVLGTTRASGATVTWFGPGTGSAVAIAFGELTKKAIPLIVVTGYTRCDDKRFSVLTKPCSIQSLLAAISKALAITPGKSEIFDAAEPGGGVHSSAREAETVSANPT